MDVFHEIKNRKKLEQCPDGVDHDEWEKFRNDYSKANSLEKLNHPVQVDIELNSSCNMACPFCIHGYEMRPRKNLSFNQYKNIVDQAVALGVRGLKLNYLNEPMLRKDLEKCIKYAKNVGILNVYFVTNGTLLNKKRRASIIESGVTKIFVSLDAVTEDTYNKQRSSRMKQRVQQ